MCEAGCPLRRTLDSGKPVIGHSVHHDARRPGALQRVPAVLRDAAGRVCGGVETFRDLSEVEALRREWGQSQIATW
jgi:hypothetical protein